MHVSSVLTITEARHAALYSTLRSQVLEAHKLRLLPRILALRSIQPVVTGLVAGFSELEIDTEVCNSSIFESIGLLAIYRPLAPQSS